MNQPIKFPKQNPASDHSLPDNQLISFSGLLENLSLTDLVSLDDIRSLFELQYTFAELPVGLIDLDNNILFGVGWQEICLDFHRKNPDSVKLCYESDAYIQHHLGEEK